MSISPAELSRYYRRTAPRLADWRAPPLGGFQAVDLAAQLDATRALHPLAAALRITRQSLICKLIECELDGSVSVDEVTRAMSDFAELALGAACADTPDARHLIIAGMGKLGAGELNVSSDIDIVYLYDEAQLADADGKLANGGLARAARSCTQLLNNTTEHGFVFRVDTRLRPNGDEGPTVCSFDMLEQYFAVQGRPWERFAWLRARLMGAPDTQSERAWNLVVQPFVYRRYMDFGVIESLRSLHAEIRQDAQRRAAKNPAASGDIKRSRGGIRELEFFVQLLQLVRGGLAPELRERHTRKALATLAQHDVITPAVAEQLDAAYTFLRKLENRIQYLDDAQTHCLPSSDSDIAHLAAAMGLGGSCKLLCALDEQREVVAAAFDSLLTSLGEKPLCSGCGGKNGAGGKGGDIRKAVARALAVIDDDGQRSALERQLTNMADSSAVARLPEAQRERLWRIVQKTLALLGSTAARSSKSQTQAIGQWLDWLASHASRTNYLAFFDEHPHAVVRIVQLFDACEFAARYVRRFPGVVDELVTPLADTVFDASAYTSALRARLLAIEAAYPGDVEPILDGLRRAYQLEVFRIVMRDIEQHTPVEAVSDDLSALADATLQLSLSICWRSFSQAHVPSPQLAIIGYGKLGSKELGYASDLDLVLIYADDCANASAIYGQFAKRWINWQTTHTGAGKLFEIDTRLRPNGNAGLLVTSLAAFEQYQLGRAGNAAWTWEHQALTKARFCAGDATIGAAFERIRAQVICAPRDLQALAAEVQTMRARISAAHAPSSGLFDIKHDAGGLVDAEFAVQLWVLGHAAHFEPLSRNSGTIALIAAASASGLVEPDIAAKAQVAYRELRARQHMIKLAGAEKACVPAGELAPQRAAISALWQAALASASTKIALTISLS